MRERINEAMKDAMRLGQKARVSTLRLINAAIKDRDIAARADEKGEPTGKDRADDQEILSLLQKMIKQRRESADTYRQAGRVDLAEKEEAEISVIEEFLPRQMTEEEMRAAVKDVMSEVGCTGLKDMGRTMSVLKERFAGRMDFGRASAMIKDALK